MESNIKIGTYSRRLLNVEDKRYSCHVFEFADPMFQSKLEFYFNNDTKTFDHYSIKSCRSCESADTVYDSGRIPLSRDRVFVLMDKNRVILPNLMIHLDGAMVNFEPNVKDDLKSSYKYHTATYCEIRDFYDFINFVNNSVLITLK